MQEMKVGVYLLIHNHEIVYVGQTMGLRGRLSQHRRDKTFDRYKFFEFKPENWENINAFEERLIRRFKPKYNKRIKSKVSIWVREMALRNIARRQRLDQYKPDKKLVTSNQRKSWKGK